jgi:hypothetical protein
LTGDDIENLSDEYFKNSEEILRGFYRDGFLSDELLKEYKLTYLAVSQYPNDQEKDYEFPNEQVTNLGTLREHIGEKMKNPIKIVSVEEMRLVKKGQTPDETVSLDIKGARENIMQKYTPRGVRKKCFCQMCRKLFSYEYIEVNNLEYEPGYFFSELRVALCVYCSKTFEMYRDTCNGKTHDIQSEYLERIKTAQIPADQGVIDIPICGGDKIRFTATHLAEIQEILNHMPE